MYDRHLRVEVLQLGLDQHGLVGVPRGALQEQAVDVGAFAGYAVKW